MKNKNTLKTEKVPDLILKFLKNQKDPKIQNLLKIYFAKAIAEPSLQKFFDKLQTFDKTRKELNSTLFSRNSIIMNPGFKDFKKKTNLPKENDELEIALNAYILGELSNYKNNAQILSDFKNKKQKNVLKLYYEFEKYSHIPVIATKTIEAVRNGVY